MVSVALVERFSAEVLLAGQIQAFIAQRLRVDIASLDAHSHLTDDFGLDLFEITELLTALEERFGVDAEAADEPNQIDFVGDLIRYIENSKHCLETREAGTRLRNGSVDAEQLARLDAPLTEIVACTAQTPGFDGAQYAALDHARCGRGPREGQ